jgi:hypothetical protein
MATLIFTDGGFKVATAAWSVSTFNEKNIKIAYVWGADGLSMWPGATGTSKVKINLPFDGFLELIRQNAIVDLRGYQK